jgi:hypothetical protein
MNFLSIFKLEARKATEVGLSQSPPTLLPRQVTVSQSRQPLPPRQHAAS